MVNALAKTLTPRGLDYRFLKRLAGKLRDPAVWLNGARLEAGN